MGMACRGYQNTVSVFLRMLQVTHKSAKYIQCIEAVLSHHIYIFICTVHTDLQVHSLDFGH